MDTSLNTDTLHGVQPTLIGRYMIDTTQAPLKTNCASEGFYLDQPGFHCDVRHRREGVADAESELLGLDRRITKQEPPRPATVPQPVHHSNPPPKDTYGAPFEPQGTRTGRSCNVLAGVNVDRFEEPMHNPQAYGSIAMDEPFRGGFQSRIAAKDCQVVECGAALKLRPAYGTRCIQ